LSRDENKEDAFMLDYIISVLEMKMYYCPNLCQIFISFLFLSKNDIFGLIH